MSVIDEIDTHLYIVCLNRKQTVDESAHEILVAKGTDAMSKHFYFRFFFRKIGYINFLPKSVSPPVNLSVSQASCNCFTS